MAASRSTQPDRGRIGWTAAAVTVIAVLVALSWRVGPQTDPAEAAAVSDTLLSAVYDPPTRPVEIHLARGDGQVFATHAQDPLVRRPELIRGGRAEQAYRLQRPLYGWLGWTASAGQAVLAPWALILVTAASAGLLAGAIALVLEERGRDGRWAALVLLVPGVMTDLTWVGPETLGAALLVIGIRAWRPPTRNVWAAVVAFALAGLARETLLLVPAVLVLVEISLHRRRWRDAVLLAGAAVPYAAWVIVVRLRIGVWPEGSVEGRLSAVPFRGLVDAAGRWAPSDLIAAALVLVPAVVVLIRRSDVTWSALVVGHLALGAVLGAPVWARYVDFGRVLLPLAIISLLALVPTGPSADAGPADPGPAAGGDAGGDADTAMAGVGR